MDCLVRARNGDIVTIRLIEQPVRIGRWTERCPNPGDGHAPAGPSVQPRVDESRQLLARCRAGIETHAEPS